MKTFVFIILFIPSFIYASQTATTSVGGTLKVYQTLTTTGVADIIWPAQFAGTPATGIVNIDGGAPAAGIPNIAGDTQGRAGKVSVTGSGGTSFSSYIGAMVYLTNGVSNISPNFTLHGDAAYTTGPPTIIPGTNGQLNQTTYIYIKGSLSQPATILIPGIYTGTATVYVTFN